MRLYFLIEMLFFLFVYTASSKDAESIEVSIYFVEPLFGICVCTGDPWCGYLQPPAEQQSIPQPVQVDPVLEKKYKENFHAIVSML